MISTGLSEMPMEGSKSVTMWGPSPDTVVVAESLGQARATPGQAEPHHPWRAPGSRTDSVHSQRRAAVCVNRPGLQQTCALMGLHSFSELPSFPLSRCTGNRRNQMNNLFLPLS